MNSSGFSISQYRSTETTALSGALDLTSAATTVLLSSVLGAESDIFELLGVRFIAQADAGAATTAGVLTVQVTPADGSAAYTIEDDSLASGTVDFTYTFDLNTSQGDVTELNLNKFAPHRNRAAAYPQVNAGDTLQLVVDTQGVGGTQSVRAQFVYRNLGSAADTSFTGQDINGTTFVGTGVEYPYSSAEGYPNYGRKADET